MNDTWSENTELAAGGAIYAPADFPDANGIQPSTITNVVTNMTLFHAAESTDRQQMLRTWRRKVRDVLSNHQEKILQYFTKALDPEHPLRQAKQLITRFSRSVSPPNTDWSRNASATFREILQDASGTGVADLNNYVLGLERARANEPACTRWVSVNKQLLEYLKTIGEELMTIETKLVSECHLLDNIAEKVGQLVALPQPPLPGFPEMMEEYMRLQFENHKIGTLYWNYIDTLQKYSVLREMLLPTRTALLNDNDPLCSICMTEVVTMAFVPCGHTFCQNCAKRTLICHVCRSPIVNRLRVFFG
jgi:hypothetical protein